MAMNDELFGVMPIEHDVVVSGEAASGYVIVIVADVGTVRMPAELKNCTAISIVDPVAILTGMAVHFAKFFSHYSTRTETVAR